MVPRQARGRTEKASSNRVRPLSVPFFLFRHLLQRQHPCYCCSCVARQVVWAWVCTLRGAGGPLQCASRAGKRQEEDACLSAVHAGATGASVVTKGSTLYRTSAVPVAESTCVACGQPLCPLNLHDLCLPSVWSFAYCARRLRVESARGALEGCLDPKDRGHGGARSHPGVASCHTRGATPHP